MNKPKRHSSHILSTTSKKFFEGKLPDEWLYNVPEHDYGIDYHIEIAEEEEVTGLNFSVQLKSTAVSDDERFSRITLKSGTLGYLVTRLEPVMLIQYEKDSGDAYWGWLEDFSFDLSDVAQKTFTLPVPKTNRLSETDWHQVSQYVQQQFNRKSFIADFDVFSSQGKLEKEAWKSYYRADFEQAVYLFRQAVKQGLRGRNIRQALAWSLYQCYQYREALALVNTLLEERSSANLQQTKACILAEYGKETADKGKLLQAQELFAQYLNSDADGQCYYNYANTLSSLNQHGQAVENFRISISKNPNNAQCWKNLGTAYYHLGMYEEEMKCYDSALAINENLLEALFSKAVTLAQVHKEYPQAIKYFDRVLSRADQLPPDFAGGFYWVAFCHAELDGVAAALKWLDKGLDIASSNPYLLRLKAQLLAKHWKGMPEISGAALKFFKFMWELNRDFSMLAQIIRIEGWELKEVLDFLKGKTPLYDNTSVEDLGLIGFGLDEVLRSVEYLSVYHKMRELYPPERYINELISVDVVIKAKFWGLFDAMRAYALGEGMNKISEEANTKEVNVQVISMLLVYLPRLVNVLLDGIKVNGEDAARVFTQYYFSFDQIMHREIGVMTGHLTGTFGLDKFDAAGFLSEEIRKGFGSELYDRLKQVLNLD